jgi:hypothetical protein
MHETVKLDRYKWLVFQGHALFNVIGGRVRAAAGIASWFPSALLPVGSAWIVREIYA